MIPPDGITGEQPEAEIQRWTPAPFLREGERDEVGKNRRTGMGELELPLPVLIPTRLRQRGSTAHHRGSTAWAEVPHQSGSTALPGGSKKLLPRGGGSTVLPSRGSTVAGCGSTVSSRKSRFQHTKIGLCKETFSTRDTTRTRTTQGRKTTRSNRATLPLKRRERWPEPPMFELAGMAPRRIILGPMTKTRLWSTSTIKNG